MPTFRKSQWLWSEKISGVTVCIMTSRASLQATSSTTLAALADPPIRQIDGAAMDYFLIELVATLRESAAVAAARSKKVEQKMLEAGLIPPPTPVPSSLKKDKDSPAKDSVISLVSRSGSAAGGKSVVDDDEEPVRQRLEAIGMHVGANFSERSVAL
jgi:trafficking protein particle complex subunit 6